MTLPAGHAARRQGQAPGPLDTPRGRRAEPRELTNELRAGCAARVRGFGRGARTRGGCALHAAPRQKTPPPPTDPPTLPPAPRGLPLPSHPVGGPGPRAPGPWAGARRRAECGAPRRGGAGAGLGAGAVLSLNLRFILV